MSKPKPEHAEFCFDHDGTPILVVFVFSSGRHSCIHIHRGDKSIRVENARGEYKPRVTDCLRLIEQTANGASPLYRGRQRASRAAKPAKPSCTAGLKIMRGDE